MFRTPPTRAALALTALAALGLAAAPQAARAQTAAVDFVPGAFGLENNAADAGVQSYTLGFSFTVTAPVALTGLGYFDDPSFDPAADRTVNPAAPTLNPAPTGSYTYADSHDVGIYQEVPGVGFELVFSTGVTAASPKTGDFRYSPPVLLLGGPATDFVLVPGANYVIAGVTGPTDPYVYSVQTYDPNTNMSGDGLSVASPVVYGQDRFTVGSSLADFPAGTAPADEPGYFGPNFLFVAAPEPSQCAGLALGALGLSALALRARRRLRA